MQGRRLAPPDDARQRTMSAKQEDLLSRQCPSADPLAAASQKIRRKKGAGKPGDYDAILPTARARRGGIFPPRVARIFLYVVLRDPGGHTRDAKGARASAL